MLFGVIIPPNNVVNSSAVRDRHLFRLKFNYKMFVAVNELKNEANMVTAVRSVPTPFRNGGAYKGKTLSSKGAQAQIAV